MVYQVPGLSQVKLSPAKMRGGKGSILFDKFPTKEYDRVAD